MGYGDNRRTPKMRQRKSRAKLFARRKRKAAEVHAARQANKAVPAETGAVKKTKTKKDKKADKS